jgi:hypothetical protein
MKYLILAALAANLAVVPAMAQTPGNAMKAENGKATEQHGKMADGMAMSNETKDGTAMKSGGSMKMEDHGKMADGMAMKKADKKSQGKTTDAMKGDMPMQSDTKDMKH